MDIKDNEKTNIFAIDKLYLKLLEALLNKKKIIVKILIRQPVFVVKLIMTNNGFRKEKFL